MRIIIIILSGGIGIGWMVFGVLITLGMGSVLAYQDHKEWEAIESEARALLMPESSYYDSAWHYSRAMYYFQEANYEGANRAFKKSFELYPNVHILNFIAATYYCLGDFDSAIEYWEAAVQVIPDNADLRKNLRNAQNAREKNLSFPLTLRIEPI